MKRDRGEIKSTGKMSRRKFLASQAGLSFGLFAGHGLGGNRSYAAGEKPLSDDKFESEFASIVDSRSVPGMAACMFDRNGIQWSRGMGMADVDNKIPMTISTIMNIASISKTVTATAVMQLWERGAIKLDDDVNGYLPLTVRNPHFPATPITVRQLLTHTSSIADSDVYDTSYSCGDPAISLNDWLREYFSPDGKHFNQEQNFHKDSPGSEHAYTNVGFGLLGLLVESVADVPFADFCRQNIFQPLGMTQTSWYLDDIDQSKHAIPYSYATVLANLAGGTSVVEESGMKSIEVQKPQFVPNCLYSFPNYPDGLVRTSVDQFARFARVFVNRGEVDGRKILEPETVKTMFTIQDKRNPEQGIAWFSRKSSDGSVLWGHDGGDPGVSTMLMMREEDGRGLIVFQNCDRLIPIRKTTRLLIKKWFTPLT